MVTRRTGLVGFSLVLAAEMELALANLDSTTVKKERLDHIQKALTSALETWQMVNELQKVGLRGGGAVIERQTRAAVFKFREMWLEEKAAAP